MNTNYYDELIINIEKLISLGKKDEAIKIIDEELALPYVPRDIEEKLSQYLIELKEKDIHFKSISDDEMLDFLSGDETHQLIAVDELSRRNLRDYIDICDEYLKGDNYINSKALLIDSLIRQEINYVFTYINNSSLFKFNPSKLQIIEETDEFKDTIGILNDYYLKDPSKLQLACQLVYKEAMLSLPNRINGEKLVKKIISYIDDAFSAK